MFDEGPTKLHDQSFEALWRAKAPEMEGADYRAQLLVLPRFISRSVAESASTTWSELSAACHQRSYSLPPTAGELAGWYESVDALVREVARATKGLG
jgi:hypothetical protein